MVLATGPKPMTTAFEAAFDKNAPKYETKTTTTTDGGHAKAELALRFLEFSGGIVKSSISEGALDDLEVVRKRCMDIIRQYFRP